MGSSAESVRTNQVSESPQTEESDGMKMNGGEVLNDTLVQNVVTSVEPAKDVIPPETRISQQDVVITPEEKVTHGHVAPDVAVEDTGKNAEAAPEDREEVVVKENSSVLGEEGKVALTGSGAGTSTLTPSNPEVQDTGFDANDGAEGPSQKGESNLIIRERELQPWVLATIGQSSMSELQMPDGWKPDEQLLGSAVLPSYLASAIIAAVYPTQKTTIAPHGESTSTPTAAGSREPHRIPSSPVLVFINAQSGGRLGPSLRLSFIDLLGPAQVFDLKKVNPLHVLKEALDCLDRLAAAGDECAKGTRANIRVLVAGGDGTVGWLLSTIATLKLAPESVPPLAIIPLGTGNDLARSFGWGATFTSPKPSRVRKLLLKVASAEPADLDCWQIVVRPSRKDFDPPIKFPHALQPQMHHPIPQAASQENAELTANAFSGTFYNYFSLGMDAQIAYGFHNLREKKPSVASSRVTNQMIYAGYTCSQGWFCTPCTSSPSTSYGLSTIARIEVKKRPNTAWTPLELPASVRALVLLNLQSYAGGRDPWGTPTTKVASEKGWEDAKVNDGLMEIVGLKHGWHAALLMGKLLSHAYRLDQVHAVRVDLGADGGWNDAYMQMDGEPWKQPLDTPQEPTGTSTFVEISCCQRASKLLRTQSSSSLDDDYASPRTVSPEPSSAPPAH